MKVDSAAPWPQIKESQTNKMGVQREIKIELNTSIPASPTEASVIKSTRPPNCPLLPGQSERFPYTAARDKDPAGNGVPLKDNECCWDCRFFETLSLCHSATTLVTEIRSELQNFRAALAQEYPELSATPFDFTVGADGRIEIVKSGKLTNSNLAILTDAIRNYKPLSSVVKAHAEALVKYSSYFLDKDGESPLSYQNFSDRVNYAKLLADINNTLDIFGNEKQYGESYPSKKRTLDIEV